MKLTHCFNRNDAQLRVTSLTHIHTTTYTHTHSHTVLMTLLYKIDSPARTISCTISCSYPCQLSDTTKILHEWNGYNLHIEINTLIKYTKIESMKIEYKNNQTYYYLCTGHEVNNV